MKILVTGRQGQVARSLAERARSHGFDSIIFAGRTELDFERSETIDPFVRKVRPDLIVNTAAWTAVDAAEDEPDRARLVNATAPGILAKAADSIGTRIIHLSTDYVYDGRKPDPYTEDDPVNPQSVYGRTKLEGEERIRDACDDHLILRTAWVYSPFGSNFVKTILSLAESRDQLKVVDDQIGNPTSALDLADAILTILKMWEQGEDAGLGKIFHCAGSGEASWADLARHVFETSRAMGGPFAEVEGIPGSAWPTKVNRPVNSQLDSQRLQERFGLTMPDWRVSARETVLRLLKQ